MRLLLKGNTICVAALIRGNGSLAKQYKAKPVRWISETAVDRTNKPSNAQIPRSRTYHL